MRPWLIGTADASKVVATDCLFFVVGDLEAAVGKFDQVYLRYFSSAHRIHLGGVFHDFGLADGLLAAFDTIGKHVFEKTLGTFQIFERRRCGGVDAVDLEHLSLLSGFVLIAPRQIREKREQRIRFRTYCKCRHENEENKFFHNVSIYFLLLISHKVNNNPQMSKSVEIFYMKDEILDALRLR